MSDIVIGTSTCPSVMSGGVPDTNQDSGLAPNVCCGYQDTVDQVIVILYFWSINIFSDASPYEIMWVQIRKKQRIDIGPPQFIMWPENY
jgi:hypothetical protein